MNFFKSYTAGAKTGLLLGRMATIVKNDDPAFNLGLSHGRIVRCAGEDMLRAMFATLGPLFD